jgi:hypothetical protein
MPTIDLSRHATDFRKHYDGGVRMQMGRVLSDDDFNDAQRLDVEDARRVRADVIGPAGSPDDGFRLKIAAGQLTLSAGTFYVGGLRLELELDEPFALQKDWLQQGANPGEALAPAAAERFDFVWLEAYQEPVTGVQDKELLEAAHGGGDTSARIRTTRRAHILENVGRVDCGQAWQQLKASLAAQGALNADFELVPNAVLKVEDDGSAGSSDLCSPSVNGGYLGAENQAIRVQLLGGNQFTWGFDNAAPVYRVKLLADSSGALRRIQMLTPPKDQAHYPLQNQVVELLPWGALLSNGQKTAELSGHFAKVSGSYNPDTREFFINTAPGNDAGAPPMPFGERWSARGDAAAISNEAPPEDRYFYLRVWNRGADTASPAKINFVPGTPKVLEKTGLQITFTGAHLRKNDFWIIAARPETPNVFVPWELSAGRAPHGVRRWIAPLGIICWPGGVVVPEVIHDCRPTFLPLTRIRGCCTYTVGDGTHSFGHFTKIQDAINALGPDGGQVCVLPGLYTENVLIAGRRNITVHGCGPRSRVAAPAPVGGAAGAPVFTIRASTNIRLEDLAIIAQPDAAGVLVEREARSQEITLAGLYVEAARRSGIEVQDALGLTIERCDVIMADVFSEYPAVFVVASDALIERNVLITPARGEIGNMKALFNQARYGHVSDGGWLTASNGRGGLQLGGRCRHVRVRDNFIVGGIGHGITLGSFRLVRDPRGPDKPWVIGIDADCEGCEPGGIIVIWPGGGDDPSRVISAGKLRDIRIEKNRIYKMGLCGIGVAGFFDLRGTDEFITVEGLWIFGNDIRFCLQRDLAEIPENMIDSAGYGGISLADVENLLIYDNHILDNGRPNGGDPICGIFVLHGEGVDICRNRLLNNGPRFTGDPAGGVAQPQRGRRGGINIAYAISPTVSLLPGNEGVAVQNGVPAARIHDNIVSTPLGQALSLVAFGAVSVEGNQFTTRGVVQGFESPSFFASTVYILNLGVSAELYLQALAAFSSLSSGSAASQTSLFLGVQLLPNQQDDFRLFALAAGGNVLFSDNQVMLDLLDPTGHGVPIGGGALAGLQLSSILIVSLDDVGFADNQCDCNLFFNFDLSADFVFSQAILAAWSVRMADNRLKEGWFNAQLSGITFGLMNATTNNQSTHCIFVYGPSGWKVNEGNRVLTQPFTGPNDDPCARFVAQHQENGFFTHKAILTQPIDG